ncbi:Pyrrolo-quinoline quinone [Beijerinckiaceae bacterium RH AL1]|nr:PQQ-binding-like beta-propeller repeat protein [Beijerinckiaceae bacterium]VVB48489.1 Pyrrolo-quinoline quinone [Beijerinckiaceae bacterium RH CH11]VVB48570.1 Pyrrolo-quinoline quinone [Beijerinckiaceae bacterium RH AL8]VVC56420.1 Pyrrolo-quinoline quinone [Beijerinckiaceae bacterium RH AL1]
MRRLSRLMPIAIGLAAAALPAHAEDADTARILAAAQDTANWLTNGRDYAHSRFSPLDEITTANVTKLAPRWIYQTGKPATFETTPLVDDGVMYMSEPFSSVTALDAATGKKLWHFTYNVLKGKKLCCGPANRGLGLGDGKVYVATVDAHLIALDKATGKVAWDITLATADQKTAEDTTLLGKTVDAEKRGASGQSGVGSNSAPLYYDGKVYIGITGVGYGLHLEADRPGAPLGTVVGIAGKYGRSGFLAAFDAKTGKRLWQFDSTQKGWEGDYVATTAYGVPMHRDVAAEKAETEKLKAAGDEPWRYGGGTVWHTPALDPATKTLFFGIGNPSPQATGDGRPGDNLWTVSLVAVDAETGKLKWGFQQVPHDLWGYDVASPPSLFDLTIDGKRVPVVGEASKIGWYFVNDRATGKLIYKSEPFTPQTNLFATPTPDGVTIAPGVGGGSNWSPAAVDDAHDTVYVASMHLPARFKTAELPAVGGKPPVKYTTADPADVPRFGTLTALDLAHQGKILWQEKTPQPLVGGVLATAGGLVFTGEGDGDFDAFDAKTGQKLWHFVCGAGVNAPPITYSVAGKQYVAVAAGGSLIWGYPQGDALMVFALP